MYSSFRYRSQPSTQLTSQSMSLPHRNPQEKHTLKLPKIKPPKLSQQEIDDIGRMVLKKKQIRYGPNGCSRSMRLDRILMMKKVSFKLQKQVAQSVNYSHHLSNDRQNGIERSIKNKYNSALTPQNYIHRIYI